jgi:hypothetical protein
LNASGSPVLFFDRRFSVRLAGMIQDRVDALEQATNELAPHSLQRRFVIRSRTANEGLPEPLTTMRIFSVLIRGGGNTMF